jgi:Mn-dependent DtxR family transcriptional regulator
VTVTQCYYLKAILALTEELGAPPTMREIARKMRVKSTNSVAEMLERLEEQGLIARRPNVARGLIVTPAGKAWKNKTL